MNQKQIRQQSRTNWVNWQKNPSAALHTGSICECKIYSAWTILKALLKTHGSSLNDENLRTLITETKTIRNSRPLTIETLSDVSSETPLSPSHLLTLKADVILSPLEHSRNQISIPEEDGNVFNTLPVIFFLTK